jgi:hypothetical protein
VGYRARSSNFWATILLFEAFTIPGPFSNKVVTNYHRLLADCRCALPILNEMMNETIMYHSVPAYAAAKFHAAIEHSAGKPCLRSQDVNQPAVYACKPRKGQDGAAAQQTLCLFEVNHTCSAPCRKSPESRYWLVRLSA